MVNLLVEIGNTALKAAWSEDCVLGKTFRYQGEKVMEFIMSITEKQTPEVLTVSSVKDISDSDAALLASCCNYLLILDSKHSAMFDAYGFPPYLSCDRIASLFAVRSLFRDKACTVMDFGTTLTIDYIDADGKYEGGNVSPGCRTRFKALNRYSKSLPLVDMPADPLPLGRSETGSIESGVISGIMFEIEGYLRNRPDNIVVFTGGDAIYFAKRMKNSIFVVCNLVLMGLAIITDDYVKKKL